MAYDKGCVVGSVVRLIPGEVYDVVLLRDESDPRYPNDVACEFTGKGREMIRDLVPGEWVSIVGTIRSKFMHGRWYTNFVCYSVGRLHVRSLSAATAPNGVDTF